MKFTQGMVWSVVMPDNTKMVVIPATAEFEEKTTGMSFILRPSKIAGVGVFCTHGIKAGTKLQLFPKGNHTKFVSNKEANAPKMKLFCEHFGVEVEGGFYIPADFTQISIGWYLNHSLDPNAKHDDDWDYFAIRDIEGGEELTIDYNKLN